MNDQKNKTAKTEKRSSILSSQEAKHVKTKYIPPKPMSKGSEVSNTNVDFRKKVSEISTKSSIRKSATITASQK